MRLYRAEVCLGGNLTNTVIKEGLTAAEIIILRNIHGGDAVRNIEPRTMSRRPYDEEYKRLTDFYGAKTVQSCFPGAQPELPMELRGVKVTEPKAIGPNNKNRTKELEDLGLGFSDDSAENDGEDFGSAA